MRYRGFEMKIPEAIYQPREDTDLLADAAAKIRGKDVLEIGCGSGIIALILAKNQNKVTAVDIDILAVQVTQENAKRNNLHISCLQSDLFEKVSGRFDHVLFNFPYLPEKMTAENKPWAAGEDIEIVRRFAAGVGKHLKPDGRILFVVSSLTNFEKALNAFTLHDFNCQILKETKIPWETLYLIEARA